MQIQCHHCGKGATVGPTAKAALCPYCQKKLRLPGDSQDSLAGQVAFADEAQHKLTGRLEVHCVTCDRSFQAPIEYAGRNARCPECGQVMRIPALKVAIVPTPEKPAMPAPEPTVFDEEPDFTSAPQAPVPPPAAHPVAAETHGAAVTPAQMAAGEHPLAATTTAPSAADVLGAISSTPASRRTTEKHRGPAWGWIVAVATTSLLIVIIAFQFMGKGSGPDPLAIDPLNSTNSHTEQTGNPGPSTPTPRQPEDPRQPAVTHPRVGSKPEALAVLTSRRDIFAGSGFAAAAPEREFWKLDVSLMAHENAISLSPETSITLRADDARGRLAGWIVSRRQLTPGDTPLEIPKGLSQTVTFVFDLPAGITPDEATLDIPGVGEVTFDAPDELPIAAPRDIAGEYVEIPPRNLQPLETDPIVAAIQNTIQSELILTMDGDELTIDLPEARITGDGKQGRNGLYRVILTDGDATLWAELRLAGPDRVVLYLSDEPYSQLTFARNDAEEQLPALPTGLVSMTSDDAQNAGGVFTEPARATDTEAYELFKDSTHQPADRDGFLDY